MTLHILCIICRLRPGKCTKPYLMTFLVFMLDLGKQYVYHIARDGTIQALQISRHHVQSIMIPQYTSLLKVLEA